MKEKQYIYFNNSVLRGGKLKKVSISIVGLIVILVIAIALFAITKRRKTR